MPPVIAAVFTKAVIGAVVKMFFSFLVSQALSKSGSKTQPEQKRPGIQLNTQSTRVPLPLLYGESRPGINRCFLGTSGTDNKYVHIIGLIGEGEIEGFSDQVGGIDPLYFNNKLYTEFGASNVHYELFTGTSTQNVCTTLHTAIPEWNDPLRYTAYIYVRLLYNRDKFQGIPEITLGLKGLKVKNPHTSVTEYSNNPSLDTYDMLIRSASRGGFGIEESRITTASAESARVYCNSYDWTCNMVINQENAITDNIRLILNNFRGEVVKSADTFNIKFRDLNEESVVMALDHDNIIDGSLKIQHPDAFRTYNAVQINYTEEIGGDDGDSTWKEQSFIDHIPDSIYTDGSLNVFEIDCLGLSNLDIVQKMSNYFKERYSLNKSFNVTAGQSAYKLEPMDLITITHTMPGWSVKYARVESVGLLPNFTATLSCREEHSDFYDGIYDPALITYYDTLLPSPNDAPLNVINVSLTEEVYFYRNRSFTRLILDFDIPSATDDPFFEYVELYMKVGINEGLVGYWKFNENTGTDAFDSIGDNDGILYNTPQWTTGISGSALRFDGLDASDEFVSMGTAPELDSIEKTVCAWIYPDSFDSDSRVNHGIVTKFNTAANLGYVLEAYSGGLLKWWSDGNAQTVSEAGSLVINQWQHVAVTHSSSNVVTLYIDGVEVTSSGTSSTITSVGNDLIIGRLYEDSDNYYFDGKIDEVQIYNRVLSSDDILDLYNYPGGSGNPLPSEYNYMTRSEGNYLRENVDEGDTYYFKLRSVNIYGVRQPDANALIVSKIIVGRTDVPSNLSSMSAIANGDSVTIMADPIDDPDIEGYEVRLGDAWDGAIFISFDKNCSLRLNGVRPGTHTFWMSPRDNSKNYSATPVSATVKVFIPPGFTQLTTYGSWSWDFDGVGTHDNTEHVIYDTTDSLKCSHTSDVLVGTYTTPTYDMNAIEDVRIWGDFRTAFVSSATTWNGVVPSPTTWNDLGSTVTWNEAFNPTVAGKIQATLLFSENGSDWTEVDFFEILCAEVTARYIKVEITITDPTLDSNLYLKELNMLAYEGPQ